MARSTVQKGARHRRNKLSKSPAPEQAGEESRDEDLTPLGYMFKILNDPKESDARRQKVATILAPYIHAKLKPVVLPESGPAQNTADGLQQLRRKLFSDDY